MLITKKAIHLRFATENGEPQVMIVPLRWRKVYAPPVSKYAPWLIDKMPGRDYIDALAPIKVKREHGSGNQPTEINPRSKTREATCICVEKPKPQGYYRLFCAHDRALWMKCGMCRRDEGEARVNWAKLQLGQLL